jgi:hypothetical protein
MMMMMMPLVSSVISYLQSISIRFAENIQSCNEDINKGIEIVSNAMFTLIDKVKKYRHLWSVNIRLVGHARVQAFVHRSTNESYNITLDASSDEMQWYERILCPCNDTLFYGYPCFHSSFALVDMQTNHFDVSVWGIHLAKWYSSIYHLSNYRLQYSGSVFVPDAVNLSKARLFPNQIRGRTGRPQRARRKSNQGRKNAKVQTAITKPNAPYHVEDVNDSLPAVVKNLLSKDSSNRYKCGAYGETGYNSSSCQHKFTEYFVQKHGSFLFCLPSLNETAELRMTDREEDIDASFVTSYLKTHSQPCQVLVRPMLRELT